MRSLLNLLVLLGCFLASSVWAAPPKSAELGSATNPVKLFVVFSYLEGHWTRGITRGLHEGLKKRGIEHIIEPFHSNDFMFWSQTSRVSREGTMHSLLTKLKAFDPHYVIVCDDEAADAVMERLLKEKYPVVFTAINKLEEEIAWLKPAYRDRLTGVLERYEIEKSLKLLQDLTGGKVKTISLLNSDSASAQIIEKQFVRYFASQNKGKVKLDKIYSSGKWSDWQEAVRDANRRGSAVWMLVPWEVYEEGASQPIHLRKMGEWLVKNLRVPSISIVDVGLHLGVMASVTLTPEIMGEATVKILERNLRQKVPIKNIPLQMPEGSEIVINTQATDRLGIEIPIGILEYARIHKKSHLPTRQ